MKTAITGSSGLIGTALAASLADGGHEVSRIVRRDTQSSNEIRWNPLSGEIDRSALEGFDAIVNLAGESVAQKWTPEAKELIEKSRVDGTRFLCETVANLSSQPKVLIAASAIGYYGDRGDEWLTEDSVAGDSFLGGVCKAWEDATEPARQVGIRVINLRIGIVLAEHGGMLSRMLKPFRLGFGGKMGSGKQYFSWISLTDLVAAICHLLQAENVSGPVNAVAPNPEISAEFAKTLGKVLGRPAVVPTPESVIRKFFGEMGEALMLSSCRAKPEQLVASGFQFEHPTLESALRAELDVEPAE